MARFKAEITEMTADSDLPTVLRNALFHVLHDQLGILQSTTGADSGSLSHDDIALKYVDIKGNVTTQESADGTDVYAFQLMCNPTPCYRDGNFV